MTGCKSNVNTLKNVTSNTGLRDEPYHYTRLCVDLKSNRPGYDVPLAPNISLYVCQYPKLDFLFQIWYNRGIELERETKTNIQLNRRSLPLRVCSRPYLICYKNFIKCYSITLQIPDRKVIILSDKYSEKTIEIFNHMDKGLTAEQARMLVKGDKPITSDGLAKIQQKYKQHSLTHPKRIKKAAKAYDNVLSGKPVYKDGDKPNINQVLTVAKEILDRAEPKIVKSENLSVSIDLSPVDLNKYRN